VDLLREEAELDQRPRVGDDAELFERLRALRKVADDERRQTVIGMSLLLGIALPKALSGLTGGASVFFGNNIMVGVFSAIILNALFVALPDLVAKHRAPASVDVPAADPADETGAAAYDER
jgi:NCS2 family nucleobase:cation symporter-2